MEANQRAADNIIDLYIQGAAQWDSKRQGQFIEQCWLDSFLALVPPGGQLLDIGCGGGIPVAGYCLANGFRVCGIDSAAPLIARCQSRFPGSEWQVMDMRRLALGRQFDGLLAWDSFFHLTREAQRQMFARFRHHARAGAALMFTSGPENGEAIGQFIGQPLYHASLSPDEYRQRLAENGFQVVAHRAQDPDCGGHTVWLARRTAQ